MQINAPAYAASGGGLVVSGGTIILNLQNGNLTGCPNGSSSASGSNVVIPLGNCSLIGVMDVTGVNGSPKNIQVSITIGLFSGRVYYKRQFWIYCNMQCLYIFKSELKQCSIWR